MKKEFIIFLTIFLLLTLAMHFDVWLSHPLEHLQGLANSGVYGLGWVHPLVFTFMVYLLVLPIRGVFSLFKK